MQEVSMDVVRRQGGALTGLRLAHYVGLTGRPL